MTGEKCKTKQNMEKGMISGYVIKPKEHIQLLHSAILYISLASHTFLGKTLDTANRLAPLKHQSLLQGGEQCFMLGQLPSAVARSQSWLESKGKQRELGTSLIRTTLIKS